MKQLPAQLQICDHIVDCTRPVVYPAMRGAPNCGPPEGAGRGQMRQHGIERHRLLDPPITIRYRRRLVHQIANRTNLLTEFFSNSVVNIRPPITEDPLFLFAQCGVSFECSPVNIRRVGHRGRHHRLILRPGDRFRGCHPVTNVGMHRRCGHPRAHRLHLSRRRRLRP